MSNFALFYLWGVLFLVLKILILKTTLQEPYNITYDI